MPPLRWPFVARLLAPIAIGVGLAALLFPLACRLPNFVVPDDGFFYAEIAYRLGLHGRSTFDGVHTTSGYHLPWALLLALTSRLVAVFTEAKAAHLFAHLAVSMVLAVATVQRLFRSPLLRVCAFVVLVSTFSLTEMVLAAPILLALLRAYAESDAQGERKPRHLALLAFALPLVRVDLVCVPVVLAACSLAERRTRTPLLLASFAGVAVQLLAMKVAFGHFVSVAAWLKASATLDNVPNVLRTNLSESAFVLLSYAAHFVLAGAAIALRPERKTWAMVLASIAFLAFHTCFSMVRPWYWLPSWVGLLWVLDDALSHPLTRRRGIALVALAARASVGLVLVAFVMRGVRVHRVYADDQRAAAMFIERLPHYVPAGQRIFTDDNPGFMGFFSGYDVVDADGLVNDWAYAERMRSERLAGYLDEERLCYLVVSDADASPVISRSGLVVREDEVVPLLTLRHHAYAQADFVLYRLRAERCTPR